MNSPSVRHHKQRTGRPYLIRVLLIERNRLIDKLHIKRQNIRIQPPLFHLPAVQYSLATDNLQMLLHIPYLTIRLIIQADEIP